MTRYMEFNLVPKIDWYSTLQTIKNEKKDFETDPIVDWEPM